MDFNLQKYSIDVKQYRKSHNLTQKDFAEQLQLENHTLISLFEQGKRAPSKDVFATYCNITGHKSEEYWETVNEKPSAYLMGNIAPEDNDNLESVLEKIGMREYLFALYDRIKQ
ncbi:MAG: helix-turn-helix transcriptional regulator [Sphaerochaetaceae bacterium]|nr:helix-turn-helix transcriptional regulator [Sphaerochaetaceae bacterium]